VARFRCVPVRLGWTPPESDLLVSAIDFLPTLSRACGIDWESKSKGKPIIDGLDLWDALRGKDGAPQRNELLHWQGMNHEPQALRSGEWKLMPTPTEGSDKETKPALYHLRDDPSETKDLSIAHPERVARLSARLKELHAEILAAPILQISK